MAIDISKTLGYGGSATIAGAQVLITSGGYSSTAAPGFLQMLSTPPLATPAGRTQFSDGTRSYTGSLAFDLTEDSMSIFGSSALLGRWYPFNVQIYDGSAGYEMDGCKVTSLSLSGAAGGLISASVSFMGLTGFFGGGSAGSCLRDTAPSGYWRAGSGGLKVKSWALSMNQEVTPAYGNTAGTEPLYLRVGLVDYTLDVESYDAGPAEVKTVSIIGSSFALTGKTSDVGYQYNGLTDLGTHKHTFITGTDTGASDGLVIT